LERNAFGSGHRSTRRPGDQGLRFAARAREVRAFAVVVEEAGAVEEEGRWAVGS